MEINERTGELLDELHETLMSEQTEELLDELYATLARLVHYYNGMMREIAENRYTAEQAESDTTVLTYNEGMSVLPILADLIDLLDMQEASAQ